MKVGADHAMPESACTACGYVMDRCRSVGSDALPSPGSISVCLRCGHLMAFGHDLRLRNLTDAEIKEIAGRSAGDCHPEGEGRNPLGNF
jgi:hypothetical protein